MFCGVLEIPKSVGIQKHLTSIHIEEWLKQDVFHWRWWCLLCLIFIMVIIWCILVEKSRISEICLYITLATIIFMGVHEYGEELTLWNYPTHIIALFPPLSSINLLSLPLVYSLIYQYYKTKKSFFWATSIITAIICFILDPILTWGGFYQLLHWKYYYSILIYIPIAILVRVIVIRICNITFRHRC